MEKKSIHIHVKAKDIEDIFDPKDSMPFPKKGLNPDFLDYIFNLIDEHPKSEIINTEIKLEDGLEGFQSYENLQRTIDRQFTREAKLLKFRLKKNFNDWKNMLIIAFLVLVICIVFAEIINNLPLGNICKIIETGFIIIGWVAFWRPVDLILYEWYPVSQNLEKIKRINLGKIEVIKEQ